MGGDIELLWLVLPGLVLAGLVYWLGNIDSSAPIRAVLKGVASRTWGEYHRFLRGKRQGVGERELYRGQLERVSVYAVDRRTTVEQKATCILTDHQLLVCNPNGTLVCMPLEDVRAAHVYRDYDSHKGFSYWVAIDRIDSTLFDPQGDMCLQCGNQRQSQELTSLIQDATVQLRST